MNVGKAQVASELNACVSVRRDDAVSGLPSTATNGLAATCRIDDAGREHEQREQEQAVRAGRGRRVEQQAAERRAREARP